MSIGSFYSNLSYEISIIDKYILKNLKNTITQFNPNNIHELFYLYCYLLWNGYLSQNKYYEYNDAELYEEIDDNTFKEYKIYTGKGVCKHNAYHLYKTLKEMDIPSTYLEIKLNDIKGSKLMDIKRNAKETLDTTSDDYIGHATVFTKTNNSTFILDPTNICELEIIRDKEIYYPNGEYILDEELLRKYLPDIKYKEESTITNQLLLEYYRRMKKRCIENQKLLDSLYDENKESYKEIAKKLEYFKI